MQLTIFKSILFAALFSTSVLSNANEDINWYSIEYIIFETNSIGNQNLEPWTKEVLALPEVLTTLKNLPISKGFKPLLANQMQLHGALNRLKKLSSYTPLQHGGWIQALHQKGTLEPIYVSSKANNKALEGLITLHRGRFLHLNLDLQLSEIERIFTPTDNTNTEQRAPSDTRYRLKQTRRMKTSELHYFDHPRFGVIAKIERIDTPITGRLIAAPIENKATVEAKPSPQE